MATVRAIVCGERNPQKLAKLRNYRLRASEEDVAHGAAWRGTGGRISCLC